MNNHPRAEAERRRLNPLYANFSDEALLEISSDELIDSETESEREKRGLLRKDDSTQAHASREEIAVWEGETVQDVVQASDVLRRTEIGASVESLHLQPTSRQCQVSAPSVKAAVGIGSDDDAVKRFDNRLTDSEDSADRHAATRKRWRCSIVTISVVLLVTVFIIAAWWSHPWTVLRIWGLGLAVVFQGLGIVARWQLGSSFAGRAEAHTLVTNGLYARIQNPIYLFSSIALAGVLLYLNCPVAAIALLAVLIPVQIVRSRKEREVLAARFGRAYEEYRKRTWI
ncbi:methyltransferase family protein [Silvibacterium acidisoli]|uniref:methyltransferase family protein n=1 Tax=Acidobacteriaceae bacterium ZG23-2 TaxID=2883246 RepID=UPI00406C7B3F